LDLEPGHVRHEAASRILGLIAEEQDYRSGRRPRRGGGSRAETTPTDRDARSTADPVLADSAGFQDEAAARAFAEGAARRLRRELMEARVSGRVAVAERDALVAALEGELHAAQAQVAAQLEQIRAQAGALEKGRGYASGLEAQV